MSEENEPFKITLIMVSSVNGVVAQNKVENSFEWNSPEDRQQFMQRISNIGTVLMGSNTFKSIGSKPYPDIDFYVLTHQPDQFRTYPSVQYVNGDIEKICYRLKAKGVRHLALLGGPETNTPFFEKGLVDEIFLTIEPILMPGGMQMVSTITAPIDLRLNEISTLANGNTLLVHYLVEK